MPNRNDKRHEWHVSLPSFAIASALSDPTKPPTEIAPAKATIPAAFVRFSLKAWKKGRMPMSPVQMEPESVWSSIRCCIAFMEQCTAPSPRGAVFVSLRAVGQSYFRS
jgi:hypothetical protein